MSEKFHISIEEQDKRLDLFLSEKLNISRAKAQELIVKGFIKINNTLKNKSYKLKKEDIVEILEYSFNYNNSINKLIPQNLPLKILYEDEFLTVISKPPGIVVYPCVGHTNGTVMNAVAHHFKKLANVGGPLRPGVVHRLDKDTSGAMIIALDDEAYYKLIEMFKKRQIKKEYLAIVYGKIKDSGKITSAIGRSIHDRKKMSTKAKVSKEAITEWTVLKRFNSYSLIKVNIITGRTHQIRVHFSSIGHPILGDQIYGKKIYLELKNGKINISRQMLHAHKLEFTHPIKNIPLIIEAPIPEDMEKIIKILEASYELKQ
ncbi:MAG: RluA family pseudouridine synthase [Thermodesulfovibrio sp.]|nr:RluA family pseudouridine synthase [Thermodesulfovibrio sp.]